MRKYLYISIVLIACANSFALRGSSYSGIRVYQGVGETVRLLASAQVIENNNYYQKLRGAIQWQYVSEEDFNNYLYGNKHYYPYHNLIGAIADSLVFTKTLEDGYYRYYVLENTCDTIYSDAYLVTSKLRIEGEDLIEPVGDGINYKWREDIFLNIYSDSAEVYKPREPISDLNFSPQPVTPSYDGGKALFVPFGRGFDSPYAIEFKSSKVLKGKYKIIFQSKKMVVTGIIGVYINDTYLGNTDTYYFNKPLIGEDGVRRIPFGSKRDINFMTWNYEAEQDGELTIKVVYEGTGRWTSGNGLVMDFIGISPVAE